MNLFFDAEFSGIRKNTTLISIGIVSENGKKFYAEFSDYDQSQCDEWIKENVLKNTVICGNNKLYQEHQNMKNLTVSMGRKEKIRQELSEWLSQFDEVQFVSDVCHYDMVLLIDIFGTAFDLPNNVSAVCHDINSDIAKHYEVSEREAFYKSREDIVAELCGEFIAGDKHNSLYDAEVIKAIYGAVVD